MQSRLITNPGASGVTEAIVSQVASHLTSVTDLEIAYTTRQGHATELAAEVASGVVIALGGDGTFNEVVNGLRPGVAFAALPGGASSVYARQLGFPDDPVAAAAILARSLAADSRRSVGLGLVDGRRFTFAASVGFDATATAAVDAARRRRPGNVRPGDLHVLYEALRVLGAQGFRLAEQMTVTPGAAAAVRASYIAIANQHPYTYFGKLPVRATPRASFDSALDAVVLGRLGKRALPRLVLYALAWPRHAARLTPGISYIHDCSRFTIECDQPVAVQIDGEYVGDRERIEVGYEPGAIDVFVPPG
jgi:diacylglycerol kinase family enzyme